MLFTRLKEFFGLQDIKYEITSSTTCIVKSVRKEMKNVVIPEKYKEYKVTGLENGCFENCSSLTSVTLPDSIASLGCSCFRGCNSLISVTLPDSVTEVGNKCFEECRSLTSITLPSSVTTLGDDCFYHCESLESITLPDSVTSLGDCCFCWCRSLTSITLPNSVTALGDYCFSGCRSLTSITLPNSVTMLGDECFSQCYSLKSIILPDSVTTLGNECFSGCSSLTSITLPNSVTTLGDECFSQCYSLKSIILPDSVTKLGNECFSDCSSLESITLPDSLIRIIWPNRRDMYFSGCHSFRLINSDLFSMKEKAMAALLALMCMEDGVLQEIEQNKVKEQVRYRFVETDVYTIISEFESALKSSYTELNNNFNTYTNAISHGLNYSEIFAFVELMFYIANVESRFSREEWNLMQRVMLAVGLTDHDMFYLNNKYASFFHEKKGKGNQQSYTPKKESPLVQYYNLLGLEVTAGPEEVQKAYRQLAKKYHPDTVQDTALKAVLTDKFKEISEAYKILTNRN